MRLHSLLRALVPLALALPSAAFAQSAIMYGQLGNFDILNETGLTCHGFEIDIDGVAASEIPNISYFTSNRYGMPTTTPTATGISVVWQAPLDPATGSWTTRTLPHTVPWFQGQCYQWVTATYEDGGCEHYGVRTFAQAGGVNMRWLCEDAANPGALKPIDPPTAVAAPFYYVAPPLVPANPPQLVVEIPAPEPAEAPELFGDAQWVRVFKMEMQRAVDLNELLADNPVGNPAALESDYSIIQTEPAAGGNGKRKRHRHQSDIAPETRSIVRRIEMYHFTGNYDPVTHEALCADGTCTAPAAGELGDLISVQMTAANVIPDAVLVSLSGNGGGNVASSDKIIACGNKCSGSYTAGDIVTLSAKANSGSDFAGWTGACSGTGSCTVTVAGAVQVGAMFNLKQVTHTLSVGRSNPGTVVATPDGNDRQLNCGSACSAKFNAGAAVTLTATPPAGKAFVTWGGACLSSGSNPVCTVTMNTDLAAQASFSK